MGKIVKGRPAYAEIVDGGWIYHPETYDFHTEPDPKYHSKKIRKNKKLKYKVKNV